ncbi:MAG TPA: hypothetical protein VHE55_00900 [Fimbriimonadaceae bacterium]|nr:hypothetical protein [Fimbriimonadaceae bacterium]
MLKSLGQLAIGSEWISAGGIFLAFVLVTFLVAAPVVGDCICVHL